MVSQEVITVAAGPAAAVGKGTVDLDRSVLVQVIPKRNLSVEGTDRFEVNPSTPRTELVFDVKGEEAGDGEIWVLLRQGPIAVTTLKLAPRIVGKSVQPSPAVTRAAADAQPTDPRTATYPLLQIFESQVGDRLKYHFTLTPRPGQYVSACSPEIKRPREQYVTQLYKDIEERWLSTNGDYEAFLHELRAFGATLFDDLVPAPVQSALWAVRDTLTAVQVVAEEPFIPWELVHLKEPPDADGRPKSLGDKEYFLGQMGLIRWLHNLEGAPLSMSIRKGRSFYVIPKYPHPQYELPAAQEEIPYLKKTFGAKPVAAEVTDIRDILRKSGALDHFHFSGHGVADAAAAVDAQLMLGGTMEEGGWVPRYLKADLVAQHARLTGPGGERPLIVLNACQIGRAGWRLSSIGGFAESFIRNGAGAFVGSLWSVGDNPARDFSEAFYQAIKRGKTLAQAAVAGRAAARKAKDATWLAYVVYGYPHATVSVET